jgi:pyruvate/2-oxoglutarate dehydrogenase complex dihydrolipoamide acyltransferase (E2) component
MIKYRIENFLRTRIANIDVCNIGLKKHHVVAFIELDVTGVREKIRAHKRNKNRISFTAWMVKAISLSVKEVEQAAAYLKGKRKLIVFDDVNVSIVVEKAIASTKVPLPLVIEKANSRTIESITQQIEDARNQPLTDKDIVLQQRPNGLQNVYYLLPGFMRRTIWKYMLSSPMYAYSKMGNVSVTSVGTIGQTNGWFIPISIHPLCFGIGSITRKPIVVNDSIAIREILNVSILLDHDVIDGAQMARFINRLSDKVQKGEGL